MHLQIIWIFLLSELQKVLWNVNTLPEVGAEVVVFGARSNVQYQNLAVAAWRVVAVKSGCPVDRWIPKERVVFS